MPNAPNAPSPIPVPIPPRPLTLGAAVVPAPVLDLTPGACFGLGTCLGLVRACGLGVVCGFGIDVPGLGCANLGGGCVLGLGAVALAGGLGVANAGGCPGCLGACGFILGAGVPGFTLGACPGFGCCILGGAEIFGAPPAAGAGAGVLLGAVGVGGCLGAVVVTLGGLDFGPVLALLRPPLVFLGSRLNNSLPFLIKSFTTGVPRLTSSFAPFLTTGAATLAAPLASAPIAGATTANGFSLMIRSSLSPLSFLLNSSNLMKFSFCLQTFS